MMQRRSVMILNFRLFGWRLKSEKIIYNILVFTRKGGRGGERDNCRVDVVMIRYLRRFVLLSCIMMECLLAFQLRTLDILL